MEMITGLRMNTNFIRVGGTAADLPDGWAEALTAFLDTLPDRLEQYEAMMTNQPIWRERLQGVGSITTEEAIALGATGPILRSTGYAWDLRRDMPYLAYDEVDFGRDRGVLRRLLRPLRHPPQRDPRSRPASCASASRRSPNGDYRIQDKKVTPPPRARIDESMEALIHHFKIFTEGFNVPAGEAYAAIESPRGELGCYIVSDGSGQALPHAHPGPELRQPPGPSAPHARRHPGRRRRHHLQCRPHPRRGGPMRAPNVLAVVRPAAGAGSVLAWAPLRSAGCAPLPAPASALGACTSTSSPALKGSACGRDDFSSERRSAPNVLAVVRPAAGAGSVLAWAPLRSAGCAPLPAPASALGACHVHLIAGAEGLGLRPRRLLLGAALGSERARRRTARCRCRFGARLGSAALRWLRSAAGPRIGPWRVHVHLIAGAEGLGLRPRRLLLGAAMRFDDEHLPIALEILSRYPVAKSATIPLLHLAQEQHGWVTEAAMEHIAEITDTTPAQVLGTCSFYEMFKREPVGTLPGQRLHQHLLHGDGRGGTAAPRRGQAGREGRGHHARRAVPPWKTSSASRRAPRRRASR